MPDNVGNGPFPGGVTSLHQLRPPLRDFVGREAELAALEQAIASGSAVGAGVLPPPVVVRGMGGVGKTELALLLAHRLTPRYPDAQFYLDLRGTSRGAAPRSVGLLCDRRGAQPCAPTGGVFLPPLTAAEAMAHVIRAYHPTERLPEGEQELAGLYHSVLHGQRALLLMDNAAGREQVEPLLGPGSCLLLVTSRTHFTLPGLVALNLDALPLEEAVELLCRITPRLAADLPPPRAVYGGDRGGASEVATTLAYLCGCLPLALRLAGSALAEREDLPVDEYMARLQESHKRAEWIEASLLASYDLLSETLQDCWRALAVFPGTFDRAGAAAVWDEQEDRTQEALSELVRYSMLEWEAPRPTFRGVSVGGETRRYRLHDLVHDCAEAWLGREDREPAEQRHAVHYARVLDAANELYLQGGEALLHGLALFDLERANVEVGQAWAAAHAALRGPEDKEAARLCSDYPRAGVYCLALRLHMRTLSRWLEAAAGAAREIGDRQAEGRHLGNLGTAHNALGEVQAAIPCYEQALAIARETGDRSGEGSALGSLGNAHYLLGQVETAIDDYRQALAIAQETGDRRDEGIGLDNLGTAYRALGRVEEAIEYHRQALAIDREIGDRRGEGVRLGHLGDVCRALGQVRGDREHPGAVEYYQQALAIAREIGDLQSEGIWLGSLGNAYRTLGQVQAAIDHYQQALAIAQERGDRRREGIVQYNLGLALAGAGDREAAIECMERALEVFKQIESPFAERARAQLARWRQEG